MHLFNVLNDTVLDLLSALTESFPDDITLSMTYHRFKECTTNEKCTRVLYDEMSKIIDNDVMSFIHDRNATELFKVTLCHEYIGTNAVYEILTPKEHEFYWCTLQSIARYISIINATGDSLSMFEGLAKKFSAQKGEKDPKDLLHSLLNDKNVSN